MNRLVSRFAIPRALLLAALVQPAPLLARPFYFNKGVLPNVGETWQTVTLDHNYESMVVVCTPAYDRNSPPAVVRVRNAAGNQFQVRVQNPGDQAAVTTPVHYIVMEEGVYTIEEDGATVEAVRVRSTRTDSQGSWIGQPAPYANYYPNPVVLGQVMTFDDPRWSVFWAYDGVSRQNPPSRTSLAIGKHVGHDPATSRADEDIGYIVFDAGLAVLDGVTVFANVGPRSVAGMGNKPPYVYYPLFPEPPGGAIAIQTGCQNQRGSWCALYGPNAVSADALWLAVDKDQVRTLPRTLTTERVAYLVFADTPPQRLPVLSFEAANASGPESVSTIDIAVRLQPPQSSAVTVEYAVVGGTAQPGVDFVLPPGVLTFAPGEEVQFITLTLLDDLLEEPDETVIIALRNPSAGTLGLDHFTYTILNDDRNEYRIVEGRYHDPTASVSISFIGQEGIEYDLIFADAGAFGLSLSNQWRLAARGAVTTLEDVGGVNWAAPGNLPADTLRFYRISQPGMWDGSERRASREVYAFCPVQLHPGQNWVSLWGEPDNNEVGRVLPRSLPAGDTPNESTRISWYERSGGQEASRQIWLARGKTPQWLYAVGGSGSAETAALPLHDGFILELPPGAGPTRLPVALRVPNTPVRQPITGRGGYNLISLRAPQRAHPSQLGLIEAGFRGSMFPPLSDALWTFDARTQQVKDLIWYNTSDRTWRFMSTGFPLVPAGHFKPFQAIVLYTRGGGPDFEWTVPLLYPAPTETMAP